MQKLLLFSFIFALLWGCSSSIENKDTSELQSSFIVGIISASTTQEAGINQISTLKRGKVITFKTCIKDFVYLSAIQEESFEISGGDQTYSAMTDHNGCLNWSEEVDIDDLESMGAITTERTITGTGTYKGSVTVPLALQLLESGGASVIDNRYKDIPTTDTANKQRSDGISFILGQIDINPMISIMTQEELMQAYRRVKLQMNVTIMDSEGQGLTNHPFKIAFIDGSESVDDIDWSKIPEVTSESRNGQHITSSVLTYKRFAAEYYMKKYVVVKSLDKPFENVIQVREVYINPWQWWGRFFFWDTKWDVPGQMPLYRSAERRQPQMMVQEIYLSYTGNDENSYNVNQYMDLTFKKNYQIKFRPLLNRKISYVPGQEFMLFERIHIAQLKAKLILIRPKDGVLDLKKLSERGIDGLDDYEYVTGKEVTLKVHENLAQANFSLEFDFRQTPFMVTRSLLLAEISPANPDWEVEPVVVTVTMKSGEFWITEGNLFATELFNGIGDEGIGIFRDGVSSDSTEDGSVPIGKAVNPLAESGISVYSEGDTANDYGQVGETVTSTDDSDDGVRYIFLENPEGQDEQDELTRVPEHLQIRERASNWRYDPMELFIKMYEKTAEIEEFDFHHMTQEKLDAHMKYRYDRAYEKFENMEYTTNEEYNELLRDVGKGALYKLTQNRKVFEAFLADPKGNALEKYIRAGRKKVALFEMIARAFGKEPEYFGGDQNFESEYLDVMTGLVRLFYHDNMSLRGFHALTSDNPLDYVKITPLTFLTDTPSNISIPGQTQEKVSNTKKVLAGRDTMPISLALVDVYTQKHSTSHSVSAGLRLSPKDLVTGGLSSMSRMSATAAGNVGTVVGSFSGGYSKSKSWFQDVMQKKDAVLTSNFTLLIDQLLLEFEADTHSCLLVEANNPDKESDYWFYQEVDRDAYLVCFSQPNEKRSFKEMWYFINTANTDSTHFVDHNNLANRPIVMPLRGLRNFVEFRNSLVNRVENFIVMEKDEYEPLARHALKDLFNISIDEIPEFLTDGEYPGAVPWNYGTTVRELELEESTTLGVFGEEL